MTLPKKFKNVQHFNIKPSLIFSHFQKVLYVIAISLVLLCSLEWFFKILLLALLILEYSRQQQNSKKNNHLEAIEIRDNKLFLKGSNDVLFQPLIKLNMKQNRLFAELELHLKDEVRSEFICIDSFTSKTQFSQLMQNLRFNHL